MAAVTRLPVIVAFFRWRRSLPALLVVLLHHLFCFVSLQLNEGHLVQEISRLRQHKVSFERTLGRKEEGKQTGHREKGREKRVAEKGEEMVGTSRVTPPGDRKILINII